MDRRTAKPDELVTFRGLMALLGVSRNRTYTIYRDRSFPVPWYEQDDVRLWLRDEVEEWIRRNRPSG